MVCLQHNGRVAKARAFLDSGAGVSMISETLASTLKLPRYPQRMSLSGSFGEDHSKFCVISELLSNDASFVSKPITFTVISKMKPTQVPPNRDAILQLPSLKDLPLSDKELGGPIDIVIGNMDLDACVYEGSMNFDGLKVINTPFGWSVAGPLLNGAKPQTLSMKALPDDLHNNLARLWELDRVPEAPNLSPEADEVIQEFERTHRRVDGRYMVTLPRVKTPPELGDSCGQAVKKLLSNEKTLKAKDKLDAFNTVVRECLSLGHAEKIPWNELKIKPHYYLPVHGVFKDSSLTTKIRVFDASARTKTGFSLNDTLVTGPNLYPDLPDVIIRFQQFKVGMTADISKMFREVLIHFQGRDLHRFILRQDDDSLVDCRMKRLKFGIKPSPFLATQVLHSIAKSASSTHPDASQTILRDFYVDDYLSSANSVDQADELRLQLCNLLLAAGMTFRKWRTNSPELLQRIPEDLRETCPLSLPTPCHAPKALGVHWDVDSDTLHISTPSIDLPQGSITKRTIASGMAGVFDVLGLFAPAIIPARILLQDLWRLPLSWDDEVPEDCQTKWKLWLENLPAITNYSIPRRLSTSDSPVLFQALHGFSDASSVAYGAAIYLRRVHSDNVTSVTLVVAKARVLPLKQITIPKAELLAAHLLSRLLLKTAAILDIPLSNLHAWSDSEIVLHWLANEPATLERFVANRVHAITTQLPRKHWRHVRSHDNPADLASRGLHASVLIKSQLWWTGPSWLSKPSDPWPSGSINRVDSTVVSCATVQPKISTHSDDRTDFNKNLWKKFSSFHHLAIVIAWMFRFIHNAKARPPDHVSSAHITSEEVARIKLKLFRLSQLHSYSDVFEAIHSKKNLPKGHALSHCLL